MFNLERQERIIVISLVLALLLGLGLMAYKDSRSKVVVQIRHFNAGNVSGDKTRTDKAININEASAEDLEKLKGIGKALAARITDYRSRNGPFRSKEEIKNVDGIGDGLFNEIKDDITAE
jgi:competence ComEA-like helix-hairpin-helix protein